MTIDIYDLPFTEQEATVNAWVKEAVDLRYGVAGDPDGALTTGSDESPSEALAWLRRVRQRADRVGELLAACRRARGRAKRAQAEANFRAEDKLTKNWAERAGRRQEFSSAREREVEAKVDSFEERHAAHQVARLVSLCDESVEVLNQLHWELDGMRKDLRATIHALQFESSLEH